VQALGVTLPEAVMIDDNADNISGARGCGMAVVPYVAGMDVQAALAPILENRG
jgi:FMN phosphatase YigB (HAD superfamily)